MTNSTGKTDYSELLEVVDREGAVIGLADRRQVHGDPSLIHRTAHVLVFDRNSNLLLQKRSMKKDVAPGKWDTSVGGHVSPGETPYAAACREMLEELGISGCSPEYLYTHLFSDNVETELVTTFRCVYDGRISPSVEEIDETRYWSIEDIVERIGRGIFSPHFEAEFRRFLEEGFGGGTVV